MTRPTVELHELRKTYGEFTAVEGVSLSVAAGEFLVVLGPSGSGKTTLLSMLGGFTEPTSGRILIAGQDCTRSPPAHRPTVTVFQDYALFPHMTVAGNVSFGLEMRGMRRADRQGRVAQALRTVGLSGLEQRGIQQLSGGQRQRVALARAIAVEPSVLLLDEPLGALDLKIRRQMQEELVQLQRSLGTTFIHVTHDQDEAMSMANNILLMNNGRVEDYGPPERVYLRPSSVFSATFMGESNLFEAEGSGRSVQWAFGRLELEQPLERGPSRLHLSVRPEHVRLGPAPGGDAVCLGRGRLLEAVFQGSFRRCQVAAGAEGSTLLRTRLPQELDLCVGQSVQMHVRRQDIVVLQH